MQDTPPSPESRSAGSGLPEPGEPLSILGQRVFNAIHAFKNDLTQLSAALYYMDRGQLDKASERIKSYMDCMVRRIDEIRALSAEEGSDEPERFDLGMLLGGVKVMLLEDPAVFSRARHELKVSSGIAVRARRRNAVLAVEGMVLALVEGMSAKGRPGTLSIELAPGLLSVSGTGEPLRPCAGCSSSCADCERPWSEDGAGERAARMKQAFEACRAEGWPVRAESREGVNAFIVELPVD